MYHEDGIRVYLEDEGNEIVEFAYPNGQNPADPDWQDTRAIISAKANKQFTVVLELTKDFRTFSAKALKLTVAVGRNQQTPEHLDDIQAWNIPLGQIPEGGIRISQQWCWDGENCKPKIDKIRIPAPEAYDCMKTYNAAKGCIAVYVVRGRLAGMTDFERKTFPTDPPDALWHRAEKTIHPIRWEWFHVLQSNGKSNNGEPYIFEFRNVEVEVIENTYYVPTLDPAHGDTEPIMDVGNAAHMTLDRASDEINSAECDSDESDTNEDDGPAEYEIETSSLSGSSDSDVYESQVSSHFAPTPREER